MRRRGAGRTTPSDVWSVGCLRRDRAAAVGCVFTINPPTDAAPDRRAPNRAACPTASPPLNDFLRKCRAPRRTSDTRHAIPRPAAGCAPAARSAAATAAARRRRSTGLLLGDARRPDCACMPRQTGNHECDCGEKDGDLYVDRRLVRRAVVRRAIGATSPAGTTAYCTPARSHAEQINVQLADATTVVVVRTDEDSAPSRLPCSACRRRRAPPSCARSRHRPQAARPPRSTTSSLAT